MAQKQSSLPLKTSYHELARPFENCDLATNAAQAFLEEVGELRIKHRIADVVICASVTAIYDSGEEGTPFICHSFGKNSEALASFALGRISGERQQDMQGILKQGAKYVGVLNPDVK